MQPRSMSGVGWRAAGAIRMASQEAVMFGWFDPVARLEKRYQKELAKAHEAMNRLGDRALHAEWTAKAEATAREIDALRASRG